MFRGSTPRHIFMVNIDLRGARVYVTYKQGSDEALVEKTGEDLTVDEHSVSCDLSQEETLRFKQGKVSMQIRYVFPSGRADACKIMTVNVQEILKDGVIYV